MGLRAKGPEASLQLAGVPEEAAREKGKIAMSKAIATDEQCFLFLGSFMKHVFADCVFEDCCRQPHGADSEMT